MIEPTVARSIARLLLHTMQEAARLASLGAGATDDTGARYS